MQGQDKNGSGVAGLPDYMQGLIEVLREPLVVLDADLQVISANPAFYRKFRLTEAAVEGRRIYDLANGEFDSADLRNALETVLPDKAEFENLKIETTFPEAGRRVLELNGRRIDQKDGNLILLSFEDITESMASRRELEESEARYAQLVESINSIIIGLDAAGIVTYFNRFSEKVFGYSRNEVIGKPYIGTLVPEIDVTGTNYAKMLEDIVAHPDHYFIHESVGLSKSGEEVWFSWSACVVRDHEGNVSEILIDGNDFTVERRERINARQAYRIVSNAPDPIARLDSSRTYVFVNPVFTEIAGRSENEIVGRKLGEVRLPVELTARIGAVFDDVAETRTEKTFEAEFEGRLFLVTIVPEFDDRSQMVFFDVFARDISRRKEVELALRHEQERLRRSEEHFRSVLENSLDAAYRRDLRTDTYDYMSPVIERITGFTADEFTSLSMESILERMHPDDIERVSEKLDGILRNGEHSGVLDYRFRAKNGEYVWLGDTFTIVCDEEGRPVYRVGIVRDVTGAKQMEQQLRMSRDTAEQRAREAEEKQRIIEAIFDNVPEGFAIFNAETDQVEVVSRYLAEFAGCGRVDFRGLPIREYARLLKV